MQRNSRDGAPQRTRPVGRPSGRGPDTKAPSVWRQVFETLPAPIAVVDAQGGIVAMNEAFRDSVQRGAGAGEMEIEDLGDDLIAIIRTVASGPPSEVYRTKSSWGVVLDCRRLDEQAGLVALIAEPGPKTATCRGGSG
jgi:PAS domain-containing protein